MTKKYHERSFSREFSKNYVLALQEYQTGFKVIIKYES